MPFESHVLSHYIFCIAFLDSEAGRSRFVSDIKKKGLPPVVSNAKFSVLATLCFSCGADVF